MVKSNGRETGENFTCAIHAVRHCSCLRFGKGASRNPALWSPRWEYIYLLKVVNPGKFVISPAQAGPMYQSNVQTTTDPATLEVQP